MNCRHLTGLANRMNDYWRSRLTLHHGRIDFTWHRPRIHARPVRSIPIRRSDTSRIRNLLISCNASGSWIPQTIT